MNIRDVRHHDSDGSATAEFSTTTMDDMSTTMDGKAGRGREKGCTNGRADSAWVTPGRTDSSQYIKGYT